MPDLTVFLDLPAEALASRLGGSFDRIEAAGARFHEDVRRAYLRFAAAEPERWFTVDATAPREQIAEKIRARVAQALGGDGRLDGGGEP